MKKYKPNYIIHLASKVGGLYMNSISNVEMCRDNTRMNENILEACYKNNITNGIFCLPTCIFPESSNKYPMDIDDMCSGNPHITNIGYGFSKRLLYIQCQNYNKQYKTKYRCIIPSNIYGEHDHFEISKSHVIPSLIYKMYTQNAINIPGKNCLRQFIYVKDVVDILLKMIRNVYTDTNIICSGEEICIEYLSNMINNVISKKCIINYIDGECGVFRKTVKPIQYQYTTLENGIKNTVIWFKNNCI
jgi:GDP-L-fucose synthase